MTVWALSEAKSQGYEVAANTPDEFLAFVRKDMARTAKLVQELGIPSEQ